MIRNFLTMAAMTVSTTFAAAQDAKNLTQQQLDSSANVIVLQYQNLREARETCNDKKVRDHLRAEYDATKNFLISKKVDVQHTLYSGPEMIGNKSRQAVGTKLVSLDGKTASAKMYNDEAVIQRYPGPAFGESKDALTQWKIDSTGNTLMDNYHKLHKTLFMRSTEDYRDSLTRTVYNTENFLTAHGIKVGDLEMGHHGDKTDPRNEYSYLAVDLILPDGRSREYRKVWDWDAVKKERKNQPKSVQ